MTRAAPRIPRASPPHRPKPNTRVRLSHRAFVRLLPCVKCGRSPCDAAHVRAGTDGGAGLKPSDRYLVPLCRPAASREGCHPEQHRRGELTFWAELGIDPIDLSLRLWTVTGDLVAGNRAVFRARQAIELHRQSARTP